MAENKTVYAKSIAWRFSIAPMMEYQMKYRSVDELSLANDVRLRASFGGAECRICCCDPDRLSVRFKIGGDVKVSLPRYQPRGRPAPSKHRLPSRQELRSGRRR